MAGMWHVWQDQVSVPSPPGPCVVTGLRLKAAQASPCSAPLIIVPSPQHAARPTPFRVCIGTRYLQKRRIRVACCGPRVARLAQSRAPHYPPTLLYQQGGWEARKTRGAAIQMAEPRSLQTILLYIKYGRHVAYMVRQGICPQPPQPFVW